MIIIHYSNTPTYLTEMLRHARRINQTARSFSLPSTPVEASLFINPFGEYQNTEDFEIPKIEVIPEIVLPIRISNIAIPELSLMMIRRAISVILGAFEFSCESIPPVDEEDNILFNLPMQ